MKWNLPLCGTAPSKFIEELMKYIHYDIEGDILSVSFTESKRRRHTGIELSDNIILYYNPEAREPVELIFLSYRSLLKASFEKPLVLEGLENTPIQVKETILYLLQRPPVSNFLQLTEPPDKRFQTSRLCVVFTPAMLQTVA